MASRKTEEGALEELIEAVRADAEYKKFKLIVKEKRTLLKIERDRNEALALLAGRSSRSIHGNKQFSPKVMLDATSNDMAARSRLVEIRVKAKVHLDTLEDACKAIKSHVMTEYSEEMRQFANAEARTAFLDRVLGTTRALTTEATALVDMLDQIVLDIDRASYHMSNMTSMIVMLDQSKGSRVI